MNDLREACIQFHLPVEPELLCQLMDYCDSDRDGKINYLDFANFLNWKDKMPSGLGMYTAALQLYGGPGSLSHDFKLWPITFQGSGPSGPILFSCEQTSL